VLFFGHVSSCSTFGSCRSNPCFWKNQDDLLMQLTEFGLATDAPEKVENRFTSPKKRQIIPLSPTLKTFRIEETPLHQLLKDKGTKIRSSNTFYGVTVQNMFLWDSVPERGFLCRWNLPKTVGISRAARRRAKRETIDISLRAAEAAAGVSSYGFFCTLWCFIIPCTHPESSPVICTPTCLYNVCL